jgi:hypothetical protein
MPANIRCRAAQYGLLGVFFVDQHNVLGNFPYTSTIRIFRAALDQGHLVGGKLESIVYYRIHLRFERDDLPGHLLVVRFLYAQVFPDHPNCYCDQKPDDR